VKLVVEFEAAVSDSLSRAPIPGACVSAACAVLVACPEWDTDINFLFSGATDSAGRYFGSREVYVATFHPEDCEASCEGTATAEAGGCVTKTLSLDCGTDSCPPEPAVRCVVVDCSADIELAETSPVVPASWGRLKALYRR